MDALPSAPEVRGPQGLNRPVFVEAGWFKSGYDGGLTGDLPVVVCLSL